MLTSKFDQENVIPVTEANLKDEQKQAIAKAMEEYKQQYLRSFSEQERRSDPEGCTAGASVGYL